MSIVLDADGRTEAFRLIGKRLRAARMGAKLTQMDACRAVLQKEQTQVSLWEKGEREPDIIALMKLSKLYSVPIDYLCGLHDDPIADPLESNQAVVVGMVSNAIQDSFEVLCNAMSQNVGIAMESRRQDRKELQEVCELTSELQVALRRLQELNPEFDNDWRGSATLVRIVTALATKGEDFGRRVNGERMRIDEIRRQIDFTETQDKVEQYMLTFA